IDTLTSLNISFSNCIAFGSDNANVMLGKKNGVAAVLTEANENVFIIGCPCHLIKIAAEKAASCLPGKVDEVLVDIFFFITAELLRGDAGIKNAKNREKHKLLKYTCCDHCSLGFLKSSCQGSRGAQRDDEDIVIGQEAKHIVDRLLPSQREQFFEAVRRYMATACDYVRLKFPLAHDALSNACVADLKSIKTMSFRNVLFLAEWFPALLPVEQQEFKHKALNFLEMELMKLQAFDIPPADVQWNTISHIKGADGLLKFGHTSAVMLGILSIPHSNAECERQFSVIKKNRTQFRTSMSDTTLGNILLAKCYRGKHCYARQYSQDFLKKAASATSNI
ncbi:unnamed protein product, partial [Ixodes pacificus]